MLIDTHCHLVHGKLYPQRVEALARATQAGVTGVICAAADLHESKTALHIAREFDHVACTVGQHPHEAKEVTADVLRQLEELAGMEECVAVGEIGLDYHYDFSPRDAQQTAFAAQLDLARRIAKPIVIHTREAFEDTLAILRESRVEGPAVIFHSFTGGPDEARKALDFGAALSFSGIATFKNGDAIRAAASLTPGDRILVETDAPYLSPEPVRNVKTNEPAHVRYVAERLATLRGVSLETFAHQTTTNAATLLGFSV